MNAPPKLVMTPDQWADHVREIDGPCGACNSPNVDGWGAVGYSQIDGGDVVPMRWRTLICQDCGHRRRVENPKPYANVVIRPEPEP